MLSELGHAHTVKFAKRGEATRAPAIRWVNTLRSNTKRSINDSHHSLRFKEHGQRYLNEAMWRFNRHLKFSALAWQLIQDALTFPGIETCLRDELTAY